MDQMKVRVERKAAQSSLRVFSVPDLQRMWCLSWTQNPGGGVSSTVFCPRTAPSGGHCIMPVTRNQRWIWTCRTAGDTSLSLCP